MSIRRKPDPEGGWPEAADYDLPEAQPWDRRAGEPPRAYAAFRIFRDLPPAQRKLAAVADQVNGSERRARAWAAEWSWRERAEAWDDECHRTEDAERLDAIRAMHAVHRRAGRTAVTKAIEAMSLLEAEEMPPAMIARFLELGAKLERSTLLVSVEELQGVEVPETDESDPWDRIARELDPHHAPDAN